MELQIHPSLCIIIAFSLSILMYGITFFLKKRNEGALEALEYMKFFIQELDGGSKLKNKIFKELNLLSKLLLTRSRAEYEERIHRYNMIDGK